MLQAMALRLWLAHFALTGGSILSPPRTDLLRLLVLAYEYFATKILPRTATDSHAQLLSACSEGTCFSVRWRRLATGSIRPAGWLQTQMQLQVLNTVLVRVLGWPVSPFRTETRERDCSMRRIEHPLQKWVFCSPSD